MNRSLKDVRIDGLYDQIMTGIYIIIPFIILYSVFSFFGQYDGKFYEDVFEIGQGFYEMIVPLMAAFIGMSIFGRYAFIPALVIGILSDFFGMGFLGGIISGLLVGYIALYLEYLISGKHRYLKISVTVSFVISTMLSFILSGAIIYFLLAPPVSNALTFLTDLLVNLQSGNIIVLVMILAGMTSFDMGGPVNKVAFSFVLAAYTSGLYHITGPALIAVTVPPLSMGLIVVIFFRKFNSTERKTGRTALLLSIVGITEGALPFAIKEPLRVVPAVVVGSMIGSGMAAYFKLSNELMIASVGGLFGTNDIAIYLLCHIVGVGITMLVYLLLKKRNLIFHHDKPFKGAK